MESQFPIQWTQKLFFRFQAIYSQKWTSAISSQELTQLALAEWTDALAKAKVTPEEIQFAINECRDKLDFPPSIKEFISFCKTHRKSSEAHTQLYLESHRAIKTEEMSVAKRVMQEIRDKLAGKIAKPPADNKTEEYKNKINPLSREFDKEIFQARRRLLITMTEDEAQEMSIDDQYDRIRYLSQVIWHQAHRDYGKRDTEPVPEQPKLKTMKTTYKDWIKD